MPEIKNRITSLVPAVDAPAPRSTNWLGIFAETTDQARYKRLVHGTSCDVYLIDAAAELQDPSMIGVVFDGGLRGWRRDALVSMVATGVPVVVGPRAREAHKLIWDIKPGVEAAGGIFEIATDESDFKCRLNAVVRAAVLRARKQEVFTQILAGYSKELASAFADASGPISRRGVNPIWQAFQAHLEQSRPEPALTDLPGVKASTQDLRNPGSGRLDGELIRQCFGLRRTELAKLLGVTPEALRQTPDSPNHRKLFEFFEQIAGLRALLAQPGDFLKWLESSNSELENTTPIELIREGRAAVVADLVQDILTNRGG
jgi:hypothetical protein